MYAWSYRIYYRYASESNYIILSLYYYCDGSTNYRRIVNDQQLRGHCVDVKFHDENMLHGDEWFTDRQTAGVL